MKNIFRLLPYIVITALLVTAAFAAGNDYGRSTKGQEVDKYLKASIKVKKKHKQYHIEYPVQEYKKSSALLMSI